jgi:hypothetical protein
MNMPSKPKYLSRRVLFQRVATYAVGASISCGVGLNRAVAQAKVSQKSVAYQDKPKDTQRCDGCSNFQPPNACKLVEGEISAQGWCSLFTKKT